MRVYQGGGEYCLTAQSKQRLVKRRPSKMYGRDVSITTATAGASNKMPILKQRAAQTIATPPCCPADRKSSLLLPIRFLFFLYAWTRMAT